MSETKSSADVQEQVEIAFRKLMMLREGCETKVYLDTRKLPTVGIGHLVVPADNLKVGDVISDDRVNALFKADSAAALAAAWAQARQAGITSVTFMPYLASVNFQLGTAWTRTFPQTWGMIVHGDYEAAVKALDDTIWNNQTPTRVADFQKALRALPPKSAA
jgi:GH24 family phage-related lysozyme (muramidase)